MIVEINARVAIDANRTGAADGVYPVSTTGGVLSAYGPDGGEITTSTHVTLGELYRVLALIERHAARAAPPAARPKRPTRPTRPKRPTR